MAEVDDIAILQFQEGGWFVAEEVFSDEECDWLAAELEATGPGIPIGEPSAGPISYRPMAHVANSTLRDAATDRRWAPIVGPIVGPDVRLCWEQGVAKPPGARTELPWHQDNAYTALVPGQYLICWLALDDAKTDNGCLWVLPGSHRRGTRRHRGGGEGPFRVGYEGDDRGVPVPAGKGSVVVLSSLLLHRSGPNTSDRHRRAWVVQFCPAGAHSANSGRPLDDRLRVARDGTWLEQPYAERPFESEQALGSVD